MRFGDVMLSPLPPPEARSEVASEDVNPEPRIIEAPRVKVLGKRRQRRREQQLVLQRLLENVDEDDVVEPPLSQLTDYAKRMIDDEEALNRFLNGARAPVSPSINCERRDRRLCPRDREARRGWLRVERCLRSWLRRHAKHNFDSVAVVETIIDGWLQSDGDTASAPAHALRIPAAVVDRRIVHALAQFHGCQSRADPSDFVVLSRPRNDDALLRHGAGVRDALRLLN